MTIVDYKQFCLISILMLEEIDANSLKLVNKFIENKKEYQITVYIEKELIIK